MPYYNVNASKTVVAWVTVEADDEEAALAAAEKISPRNWEQDNLTAELEFNIDPQVEPA